MTHRCRQCRQSPVAPRRKSRVWWTEVARRARPWSFLPWWKWPKLMPRLAPRRFRLLRRPGRVSSRRRRGTGAVRTATRTRRVSPPPRASVMDLRKIPFRWRRWRFTFVHFCCLILLFTFRIFRHWNILVKFTAQIIEFSTKTQQTFGELEIPIKFEKIFEFLKILKKSKH